MGSIPLITKIQGIRTFFVIHFVFPVLDKYIPSYEQKRLNTNKKREHLAAFLITNGQYLLIEYFFTETNCTLETIDIIFLHPPVRLQIFHQQS